MSKIGNLPILVGVDGSPVALAALRWAAVDAARHEVPLHLLYAIGVLGEFRSGFELGQFDFDSYRQGGLDALETARATAVAESASITQLDISTELVDAPPIPLLRDRSQTARLLVVGTHGLGAVNRRLLGSVSTALARHAACPVAVIPETAAPSDGPVVVGVDGSRSSVHAIEIAFDQAAFRGVELVAVHTWSDFLRFESSDQMQEEGEELLARSIAGFGEKYPEVPVHRIVTEDRPAERLLMLGDKAQLIVVGSHGRGGFAGMTLGSVGQAVLHAAQVPVIIARSAS
ncbi:universal stress protein [Nocardia abscessus]|uniref:universal stress protein n=1 Tax=Nocardia TaxID=1817 RepID=UPI0018935FAD|nr:MULTISPECIES: universal stress protein [Nocardia]MBF6221968.1 universal stress protein [Nocardia abscessus]MDE1674634.1 universal stress protein [Nocardia gipuzkoensis]